MSPFKSVQELVPRAPLLGGRCISTTTSTKFLVLGFVAKKREYQNWVSLIPVITGEEYNVEVTASSGCMLYSL
jgi:hypothetical protein